MHDLVLATFMFAGIAALAGLAWLAFSTKHGAEEDDDQDYYGW